VKSALHDDFVKGPKIRSQDFGAKTKGGGFIPTGGGLFPNLWYPGCTRCSGCSLEGSQISRDVKFLNIVQYTDPPGGNPLPLPRARAWRAARGGGRSTS
jgi:hypothetical protein